MVDLEKAIVIQPGKANREFDTPTEAVHYVADNKGTFKVFWKGFLILEKGTSKED